MPRPGLIITADDYGLNASCNRGIREGVSKGIISSVHVMMNLVDDNEMQQLIEVVRDNGNTCGIGLHLNTTWGRAMIQEQASFKYHEAEGANGTYFYNPLGKYLHKNVVKKNGDLAKMRSELFAQAERLKDYLGGPAKIDAISSHHNIHLWDARFVQIVSEISSDGRIPVRSPVRWESKKQNPQPARYPSGTGPLSTVAMANLKQAINSPSTIQLLKTVLKTGILQTYRSEIIEHAGTAIPVTTTGHWFGQPSEQAMEWFMQELVKINEATNQSGYPAELYMHLASSDLGGDPAYDYKMWQRLAEYVTITDNRFLNNFNQWKAHYDVRHGSFRKVLQEIQINY